MIDHGAKIQVVDVDGWYDAGKLDTLLETNQAMLEKRGLQRIPAGFGGATIIPPVYIEDGATASDATIGPNASIGAGSKIVGSTVRDTVMGNGCVITNSTVHDSMLGDGVLLTGVKGSMTLGDNAELTSD